jgi:Ni,Fe-hydrogenase III small subunit
MMALHRCLTSILPALCLLLTGWPWLCAAAFIYGQDGFGFSGAIRANPIVADVTMTAYDGWPANVSNIGNDAFAGGVFDGQSVWLVPFNAVVRVNVSDGGMAAFNGWPSGVALSVGNYAFGGGAFDGVSIWMGPMNAGVVVRVYTGSGDMTAYPWPTAFSNFYSLGGKFNGCVFDGVSVWLIPWGAKAAVRVTLNGTG